MRDDLFTVVHEQFPTDTVDYADIVLPATTQLEHADLHGSYGHHFVMYNPAGARARARANAQSEQATSSRALADAYGLRKPELFPDDETLIRQALNRRARSVRRGHHARTAPRPRDRSGLSLPERFDRPFAGPDLPDGFGQVRAILGAE